MVTRTVKKMKRFDYFILLGPHQELRRPARDQHAADVHNDLNGGRSVRRVEFYSL
jgi:hypothetical protein